MLVVDRVLGLDRVPSSVGPTQGREAIIVLQVLRGGGGLVFPEWRSRGQLVGAPFAYHLAGTLGG